MINALSNASGGVLIPWILLGGMSLIGVSSYVAYNSGYERAEQKCDNEKLEAQAKAQENADKVTDQTSTVLDEFETKKEIAFGQISEKDAIAIAENAKRAGKIQGYLEGQKDALQEINLQGGCLTIPYEPNSRLRITAKDLHSEIFGSREASSP